ncbi:MAG TPA: metal-dependent hydrolase, partial [Polyangiales bacterium]
MTHSLFGYALARALPGHDRASPERQRAEIWTSVVASNLPDADVLFGFFARDRRLGYLLEHRGATHTLLAALPIGIVSGLGCAAIARARTARDRWVCCLLGVLACLLHIGFDSLNNYGVQAFSPFDDHWYYGDSLFIVEPLLLFALLPLLAWRGHTGIGRAMG